MLCLGLWIGENFAGLQESLGGKRLARVRLEVALESKGPELFWKCTIPNDLPRKIPGRVLGLTAVLFGEPGFQIRCVADVNLIWEANATKNVYVVHY